MKALHTSLLVVASALAVLCAPEAARAANRQEPGTRPAVGPARPFNAPPRHEATLANGLRVVVARDASIPKITAVLVVKGAGLAADPPRQAGLAAFTADALLEGTATRTSEQLRREAFGMGGAINAFSSQDYSSLEIRGLSEYLPDLLALLADVVVNPSFPDGELSTLKARHLQALQQQRSSPQFLSNREFRRALFQEHPYGRVAPDQQALETMTRESVRAFHATHFVPGRSTLVVVGDVREDEAVRAAERAFASWKAGQGETATLPAAKPPSGRTVVFVERPGSVQSSISVGNLTVKRSDPQWYALSVTNALFGGSFNSRLVRTLREEKGYTYSPQSQFTAFGEAGIYRFGGDVRTEVTGAALGEVFREIDRLVAGGAEEQELADIKQYLRGLFATRMAVQTQLAGELAAMYLYDLPKDYLETYQTRIGAVSAADVKAAAPVLLAPAQSVISVVGDWSKVADQLKKYGDVTVLDVEGRPMPAAGSR